MSYINTFSTNRTTLVTNLGGFAGSPDNLILGCTIPNEYLNTITKFELEVGYYFYFDYIGWTNEAFRYTQDLFVLFERPDAKLGVSTVQLDTTSPGVTAFNSAKNGVLTFNPNNVSGYASLNAFRTAKIDLLNVNFIDGADGSIYNLRDILNLQGSLAIGGFASNFVRTAGSFITALNQVQCRYYANITVQATNPIT
jgi:hypothetical protein